MQLFPVMITVLCVMEGVCSGIPEISCIETVLGTGESSIRWPFVSCEISRSQCSINELLDYESVTGESIETTVENFKQTGRGIVGADFTVVFADAEFLDIQIIVETLGAYPSSNVQNFLFSLTTGEEVTAGNLFLQKRLPEVVELCEYRLRGNIVRKCEEDPDLLSSLEEYHFTEVWLDRVGMRSEGLVFHYDFQFPHAMLAGEPEEELFFTWDELDGYLLPGIRR